MVGRDPRQLGVDRPRWRLADLGEQVAAWRVRTPGGLSRLLRRLGVSRQRGRQHVHSPDPAYPDKRAAARGLEAAGAQALAVPVRLLPAAYATPLLLWRPVVTLYLDELTWYRQPTLAAAYAARGRDADGRAHPPLAMCAHRADTSTRLVGALDAATGRVTWWQGGHLGVKELVAFYRHLRAAYPDAWRLYVVQDNWPIHAHPDLVVALQPQESPWWPRLPPSWPATPSTAAARRWGALDLPIQLAFLPTYASWLNPIEKLWRWLKQDVLHLHRQADDLDGLRARVGAWLDRFATGSDSLLSYVGLHPLD